VLFPFSARPRVAARRFRGACRGRTASSARRVRRAAAVPSGGGAHAQFSSAILDKFSYINRPPRRRTPGSGVRWAWPDGHGPARSRAPGRCRGSGARAGPRGRGSRASGAVPGPAVGRPRRSEYGAAFAPRLGGALRAARIRPRRTGMPYGGRHTWRW